MGSDFRVNLYRRNMYVDGYGVIDPKLVAMVRKTNATNSLFNLSVLEKQILELIRQNEDITQKQLNEATGIPLGTIKRIVPKLQEKGKLRRVGNRRTGKWIVTE